jgi:hypothetical protein
MAALRGQALAKDIVRNISPVEDFSTKPRASNCSLIHFQDARGLHNWRFLLALGEAFSAFAVYVHTGEFLTVVIIDRYLPMLVFAPAVAVEPG